GTSVRTPVNSSRRGPAACVSWERGPAAVEELGSAADPRALVPGRSPTGLVSCARTFNTHNKLIPTNNPNTGFLFTVHSSFLFLCDLGIRKLLAACSLILILACFFLFFLRLFLRISEHFHFFARMHLHRLEDLFVIALVHPNDDVLGDALLVVIDVEPVALRFGEHDNRA